jgi:hypothetical protein
LLFAQLLPMFPAGAAHRAEPDRQGSRDGPVLAYQPVDKMPPAYGQHSILCCSGGLDPNVL